MMVKQSTTKRSESCQVSSKPRVIKLSRRDSQGNQCHHSSVADIRSSIIIHTSIGLSSRASATRNRTESIMTGNSIEKAENERYSINQTKTNGSTPSYLQLHRNQVANYNGKDNLREQSGVSSKQVQERENNVELKKDSITSTTKMNIAHGTIQTDNPNDLKMTDRLSGRMNFAKESRKESNEKIKKRQKATGHCCRCSRLCIFFSVLAAILLATALAAALVSLLHTSSTTTRLTTVITMDTTNSTTILTTTITTTTTMITTTPLSTTVTATTTTTTITTTISTTVTATTISTTTTTDTSTMTETTTDSVTTMMDVTASITTETTTVTYVPTGIYALEISPYATWNDTGITVAGNANGTAGADTSSLNTTVSIFVDNNYTLYVCDRENHRIMKYDVNATTGVVAAGTGTPGNSPSQLNEPKGVAVDQMGAIIVADSSNYRIQRFPLGSTVATTIAINSSSNILGTTRDLHIDVNNGVYVTDSDNSRIVKFYPNNGIGVILAGSAGAGSAANQFSSPFGNFMDGNQTLYVADCNNHRVQKWPAGATSGITVAGVTGSNGSSLTQLSKPQAVIVDNNGYLYIADTQNNRIVRWTDNYAAGGTCIVGCTGSSGATAVKLKNPRDLKFDPSGNLYVSDQGNNRVQKFLIQFSSNYTNTTG